MPLRLNVGVSKKVGLPEYSSVGASCNLDVELDSGLLRDLDGFHAQVRAAFVAARQAVNDELARLQGLHGARAALPGASSRGHDLHPHPPLESSPVQRNGPGAHSPGGRAGKPATPNQVKALYAIARKQRADLEGLLRDEYAVARPEDLTLSEASALIDQLQVSRAD